MTDSIRVIRKNTDSIRKHEGDLAIIRDAEIGELARITKSSVSPEKAYTLYKDAMGEDPLSAGMLRYCSLIAGDGTPPTQRKDTCRVACVKNPLSLKALTELTRGFSGVTLSEKSDFRALCEEVAQDLSDYCILPYCSSLDGYYPTFQKLVRSYELKINARICLSRPDSDEEILFALLSKNVEITPESNIVSFSFVQSKKDTLARLLAALSSMQIEILGTNSAPLEYNMYKLSFTVEADVGSFPLSALFFFLDATLPGHTVLGVYQ